VKKITLPEAVLQVMNGVLYSWMLPFTTGDILARMERNDRKLSLGKAIFLNRFWSFLVAAVFGIAGLSYYFDWYFGSIPFVIVFIILMCGVLGLLFRGAIDSLHVYMLTIARYLVISIQFYLLVSIFSYNQDVLWILGGISWVFLFRSVLPSIWGAIGVREVSAYVYFKEMLSVEMIVGSSLVLWLINLVMATLVFVLIKTLSVAINKEVSRW
jgi:hypothetical protein